MNGFSLNSDILTYLAIVIKAKRCGNRSSSCYNVSGEELSAKKIKCTFLFKNGMYLPFTLAHG